MSGDVAEQVGKQLAQQVFATGHAQSRLDFGADFAVRLQHTQVVSRGLDDFAQVHLIDQGDGRGCLRKLGDLQQIANQALHALNL